MASNYASYRARDGRWERRPIGRTLLKIALFTVVLFIGAFLLSVHRAQTLAAEQTTPKQDIKPIKLAPGQYDLTPDIVREKAKNVTQWYETKTIKASVSAYTLQESCHNRINGHCLNAAGQVPQEGNSVACPRSIKLGTQILVQGSDRKGVYTCDDRTARWVEQRFGPTFDIFFDDYNEAKQFGRQKLEITIYQPTP